MDAVGWVEERAEGNPWAMVEKVLGVKCEVNAKMKWG